MELVIGFIVGGLIGALVGWGVTRHGADLADKVYARFRGKGKGK